MENLNDKVTKAVQIKRMHDMLNGNKMYRFDFENLNNNKKKDGDTPDGKKSQSPKSESQSKSKSKSKKSTESSSKKNVDHCVKKSETEDLTPFDETAPNITSYQKVVDRVFNSHQDKHFSKLACLCTMNFSAMLVPKYTENAESPENEFEKRINAGTSESKKSTNEEEDEDEEDEEEDE